MHSWRIVFGHSFFRVNGSPIFYWAKNNSSVIPVDLPSLSNQQENCSVGALLLRLVVLCFDWSVGWSVGQLVGPLVSWLVCWLVRWSVGWSLCQLVCRSVSWFVAPLVCLLVGLSLGRLFCRSVDLSVDGDCRW